MNNIQVNRLGQEIAARVLLKAGLQVQKGISNLYIIGSSNNVAPAVIWTKTYQKRKINGSYREITGKDTALLKKLMENTHAGPQSWVLWVDALLGQVLGGPLEKVMAQVEFEGLLYPYVETTHSGSITYFSIYTLQTIGSIETEDLEKLRSAVFTNRQPKNQQPLFK